jgi:hypothetical protein
MPSDPAVVSLYQLPEIELEDGHLLDIVDDAVRAILAASEPHLFQRGSSLVRLKRIERKETKRGVTRQAGSLIISEATSEYIRCEMARTARYIRFNKKEKKYLPTDPPLKYAHAIATRDELPFKMLQATIEAPTLRADGSILQQYGYDEKTGLFFDSPEIFPPIPDNPSKADAEAALQKIAALLKDFPFVEGGLPVALASIMTALVRRSLRSAPMFVFDAPASRSGKTLLSCVMARVATGRDPATQTYTGDDDEDRKRLIATLLAGDAVVVFDNVTKPMYGFATLFQALTGENVDDRLLGTNTTVRVASCTTFVVTGNNATISGKDLSNRVLKCRIDACMEKPEEREFDYNLLDYIIEQRPDLVVAALTAMRGYVVAGREKLDGIKPWGGFEGWCEMVRHPLIWLGYGDPCASRTEVEDVDPETAKLNNLIDALDNQFRDRKFSVAEAVALAHKDANDTKQYFKDISPLHEALAAMCWKGEITPDAVGKAMRGFKDRVVGNRKLIKAGVTHKVTQWAIIRL